MDLESEVYFDCIAKSCVLYIYVIVNYRGPQVKR